MSETTPSQEPDELPAEPAPRPGLRLRPPGAAPRLPAEESDAPGEPTTPEPVAAASQPVTASPPNPFAPPEPKSRRPRRGASDSPPGPGPQQADSAAQPTTEKTSSTGSTDRERPPAFVDRVELAGDIAQLLMWGSEQANERVAPGTPLLVATDREAVGVATPAASIVARHMPAGMGSAGNPDLADAVRAGIVLFRYALRQIRLAGEIRRMRRAAAEDGFDREEPAQASRPADPFAAA